MRFTCKTSRAVSPTLPLSPAQSMASEHENLNDLISDPTQNSATIFEADFSASGMTGPIPAEIAQFENLRILDLSNNAITGYMPKEMAALVHLSVMRLENNGLEGVVLPNCVEDAWGTPLHAAFFGSPLRSVAPYHGLRDVVLAKDVNAFSAPHVHMNVAVLASNLSAWNAFHTLATHARIHALDDIEIGLMAPQPDGTWNYDVKYEVARIILKALPENHTALYVRPVEVQDISGRISMLKALGIQSDTHLEGLLNNLLKSFEIPLDTPLV